MPGANIKRMGVLGAALLVVVASGLWAWQTRYAVSGSQGNLMEVRQAHSPAQPGDVALVDVRRTSAWKVSGVPATGHAITMQQDGRRFQSQLLAAAGGDKARPLALICATGGRTTWLQARLRKAGFKQLYNVTEGMMGSRYGAGWLKKGLPVRQWTGQGSSKP